MKYKINEEVEFKASSVDKGKVVSFEEETSMYSVEIPGGKVIKCTEHYITEPKPVEEEE